MRLAERQKLAGADPVLEALVAPPKAPPLEESSKSDEDDAVALFDAAAETLKRVGTDLRESGPEVAAGTLKQAMLQLSEAVAEVPDMSRLQMDIVQIARKLHR